jgi:hypothetical protein
LRLIVVAGWVVAGVSFAPPARAADAALARSLLGQGRELLADGHYEAACDKVAQSAEQDPRAATLIDLGKCNEALGKFASAWVAYDKAETEARNRHEPAQEALATKRATAVLLKVSRLRIDAPSRAVSGLTVTRNGELLPNALLGSATPVDPGTYTIAASAPGFTTSTVTVEVGSKADSVVVQVPVPTQSGGGGGAGTATPRTKQVSADPVAKPSKAPLGWALVGGGGALLVGSGVFGLLALRQTKRPEDRTLCADKACVPEGRRQIDAVETKKLISTVGVGVGVGAICAGAYFLVTKTRGALGAEHARASLAAAPLPSGGAFIVRGAF